MIFCNWSAGSRIISVLVLIYATVWWRHLWTEILWENISTMQLQKENFVKNEERKNFFENEKKIKLFKIAWNGEKIGRKWFFDFLGPPPEKICWPYKKYWSKMKKIKVVHNCLKWRENWRKTSFRLINPPPPKKKKN